MSGCEGEAIDSLTLGRLHISLDHCNRVLVRMAVDGHFRDTRVPPACVFLSTRDGRGYYVRHAY